MAGWSTFSQSLGKLWSKYSWKPFPLTHDKNVTDNSHLEFPRGKLCLVTPIAFYNHTTGSLGEVIVVGVVLLVFSKAFDTVSQCPSSRTGRDKGELQGGLQTGLKG